MQPIATGYAVVFFFLVAIKYILHVYTVKIPLVL